ncbi:MAG TPA: hypothetical protein VF743_03970 [Acidimicrobiales bacterium]
MATPGDRDDRSDPEGPAPPPTAEEMHAVADELERQADDIDAAGHVTRELLDQAVAALRQLADRARGRGSPRSPRAGA